MSTVDRLVEVEWRLLADRLNEKLGPISLGPPLPRWVDDAQLPVLRPSHRDELKRYR